MPFNVFAIWIHSQFLSDHEGVSDRLFGRVVEEIVAASNYSNPFAALEEESEEDSEEEEGGDPLRVATLRLLYLLLYLLLFEIGTLSAILLPQLAHCRLYSCHTVDSECFVGIYLTVVVSP